MTFALDLSDDLLVMDGLQELTLRVTGLDDVFIPAAFDEPVKYKEIEASNGQLRQGDHMFVWQKKCNPRPPLGSILIDEEGVQWTILSITFKDQIDTWEAGCRALAVEAGLDNVCTILRANSYTKNASGEAVPVWTTIATDLEARWQPWDEEAQIHLDADFSKTTYHVTFGELPVDRPEELSGGDYRLVDKDGNRYRVMRYLKEQRIDALPQAIVVKILEGSEYHEYGGSGT